MIKKRLLLSLAAILALQSFLLSSCSKKETVDDSLPLVTNDAQIPTYVFYYANWCGYCHKMAPNVAQAAKVFKNKVFFYYVDIDSKEGIEFSKRYRPNGKGVPFAQYYDKEGHLIASRVGYIDYAQLERSVQALIE